MRVKILQPAVHKEHLQEVRPVSRKLCTQFFSGNAGAISMQTAFSRLRYIAMFSNFSPGEQYPFRNSNDYGSPRKNVLNAGQVFQDYVLVNKLLVCHVQENANLYLARWGLQDRKGTHHFFTCNPDPQRTSFTPFLKYNN
jgi:hypothetical protein